MDRQGQTMLDCRTLAKHHNPGISTLKGGKTGDAKYNNISQVHNKAQQHTPPQIPKKQIMRTEKS
jgi:hypothetical protein